MPKSAALHAPKSKAELMNRIFSFDFSGDWRKLDPDGKVIVRRVSGHKATLLFPGVDREFELVVRMPRQEKPSRAPQKAKEPGNSESVRATHSTQKPQQPGSKKKIGRPTNAEREARSHRRAA